MQKKGKRYRAHISLNGKTQALGTFDTSKEAAKAYDLATIQAGRSTTKLNFLDQVPKNYKPKKKKLDPRNKTGYTGVSFDGVGFIEGLAGRRTRFTAHIRIGGKRRYIGVFSTAKEAATAQDQAALQAESTGWHNQRMSTYVRFKFKGLRKSLPPIILNCRPSEVIWRNADGSCKYKYGQDVTFTSNSPALQTDTISVAGSNTNIFANRLSVGDEILITGTS